MSKVVSRGLGKRNSILSRGLGFLYKTHDIHRKRKAGVRTLEYYFNLEVAVYKNNEFNLSLYIPILKEDYFEKQINQKIYKNLSYDYLIKNNIYKNLELEYKVNSKMNNKRLISLLDVLFEE